MTTTDTTTSIRVATGDTGLDAATKLIRGYVGWATALAKVRLSDTRPAARGELQRKEVTL